MWRFVPWLALVASAQPPVVGDLHTVSIHVDGVESYNAAFRLLSNDFGWPVIYGKLLSPEDGARRNYAGIWAGNVVLEICGPYPKEFAPGDRPARLHGLTFEPYESSENSAAELKHREIQFHGPVSWSKGTTFVIIDDPAVIRPHFSVSLMEHADPTGDREARAKARRALDAAAGVRSVQVRVGYEDEAALDAWRRILGDKTPLLLVKTTQNGIQSVVLKGKSEPKTDELLRRAAALGIHLILE